MLRLQHGRRGQVEATRAQLKDLAKELVQRHPEMTDLTAGTPRTAVAAASSQGASRGDWF